MKHFKIYYVLTRCAFLLLVFLGGCTTTQQNSLYGKAVDLKRDKLSLAVGSNHAIDVEMAYLERPGDGPTVMLVHGFSANKDTWLLFAKKLPKDYHLIIPDLAGHGDTTAPENGDYDLVQQAQRLHALVDALDISSFHMVGSSMGGAISAIYASTYPEEIQSLTLMDSAGIDGDTKSEYFEILEGDTGSNPLIAVDKKSFEYLMEMVMEKQPFLPWPLRPAAMRDSVGRAAINREIFSDMLATGERMSANDFGEQLTTNVTMPVLIMWGEKDRILDVSAVPAFKQYLPQAEVVIFPEVGHLPMLEVPKKSAGALAEFIRSVQ